VHLSSEDAARLFGGAALSVHRPLSQPGQFAADQRVNVVGPKGRIDGIRVVGPARGVTQVELALSDAAVLGIAPPIANSGKLDGSLGGVTLEGNGGAVMLRAGVIVPARHLHLSVEDGRRWQLKDGDTIMVRCGAGARAAILHGVLVRSGAGHATELHLDVDEARATGVKQGDVAVVLESTPAKAARRVLVTERDVLALSARGEKIPAGALLTPGARDRARALGLAES
jgi:putative phosphotransacetylase